MKEGACPPRDWPIKEDSGWMANDRAVTPSATGEVDPSAPLDGFEDLVPFLASLR